MRGPLRAQPAYRRSALAVRHPGRYRYSRSSAATAALVGDRLYIGYSRGVYAFNARTGRKVYRTDDESATAVLSSPAVSGDLGDRVLLGGTVGEDVFAARLLTGERLWTYPTPGPIYSSPAVVGESFFVTGDDGSLYAFGSGGSDPFSPETALTQPAPDATLPHPQGPLQLSGTASDDEGIEQVAVAIKNKNTGAWWNGSGWVPTFAEQAATLDDPGAPATSWTLNVPIAAEGGPFYAQAHAIDGEGRRDPSASTVHFQVEGTNDPPDTVIAAPDEGEVLHFGAQRERFPVTVTGTATDPGGAQPGVERVVVVIRNLEHDEFYCGVPGCNGGTGEASDWGPLAELDATLDQPGQRRRAGA